MNANFIIIITGQKNPSKQGACQTLWDLERGSQFWKSDFFAMNRNCDYRPVNVWLPQLSVVLAISEAP